MGVMICAVLLLTTWVAFVFSKYNPDRRITSGSVRPPAQSKRRVAGTDNHRLEFRNSVLREEG